MKQLIQYSILFLLILLSACRGSKTATTTAIKKLSTAKVIGNHYKNDFDFNTLHARLKVDYEGPSQTAHPSITLRMEKDKTIWMSAKMLGITLAKVLITPEKISYYEKINGTYFEGDFTIVSKWLGMPLNFKNLQQLLLGQAVFDLNKKAYTTHIKNQKYGLHPKKEENLLRIAYTLYPDSYKMALQQLQQQSEQKQLNIQYPEYQKIENQFIPKIITILATTASEATKIKLTYRSVDYNVNVSFPFTIPSGYKNVTIP